MRRLASRLSLAALLLTTACSSAALAHVSAEPTGCAEDHIEITESHHPMEGPSSWTLICRPPDAEPHEWFCSRAGDLQQVICTDVPSSPGAAQE